ncbi:YraN family protein [Pseudoxanthomonas sp. JBR18]|uniref:YraN family protein n=1 Tax=Pseudoxanthomonas sp. JBR18 TaxID=2969308 RepID=UPI002305E654|nr:YraN family protein [Pseudoxanthomonas sp. JBR18]WCE05121.1 YraN family protein [Pseudoxanthomonas sp. JBR18]
MAERQSRGRAAEAAARAALERGGLQFIAANVRFRGGELDLVMRDPVARGGACLVFVEVRYRAGGAFGGGAASVDATKRRKLVIAAQLFLAQHPRWANMPCRFDVVQAQGDPARPEITWLRDAFRADET